MVWLVNILWHDWWSNLNNAHPGREKGKFEGGLGTLQFGGFVWIAKLEPGLQQLYGNT